MKTRIHKLSQRSYRSKAVITLLLFLSSVFSFNANAQGFTTIDFHQAQNNLNGGSSYAIQWVNGVLNATHTDYFEGIGVPQRIVVTGILPTTNDVHTLYFQVLASKGGKHAYDFPISWDQAYKTAQDIGNGTNELMDLWNSQCGAAFSTAGKNACDILAAVTGNKIATPSFPDVIGDPGSPSIGGNVNAKIACFESKMQGGVIRYGDRTLEIRGNMDISQDPNDTKVEFMGYQGSGADLATYKITWKSASTMVMFRLAGRLAPGSTRLCGYGTGQGAGSINGGPYHFKLGLFDGVSTGSQDNQIMSNAIQVAPDCDFSGPASGCPSQTSFLFTYTGSENVNVTFSFLSNTANATFSSNPATTLNSVTVTSNSSGIATVTVYPKTGGFTAGGSFQVQASATDAGGTRTCTTPATTIRSNPTLSSTYLPPACDETTYKVRVNSPVAGTYTLKQSGYADKVINYPVDSPAVFTGLIQGTGYILSYVDTFGCAAEPDSCGISAGSVTRKMNQQNDAVVFDSEEKISVKAYPNPFRNIVRFDINARTSGDLVLEIYDISGRKVAEKNYGSIDAGASRTISYNSVQMFKNLYLYRVTVGSETITGKILKAE